MSSHNSALASLTAQYTDSENEDERHSDDDDSQNTEVSTESQVIIIQPPNKGPSPSINRTTTTGDAPPAAPKATNKALRLVSYNDDNAGLSDDGGSPDHETINMDISDGDVGAEGENSRNSGGSNGQHVSNASNGGGGGAAAVGGGIDSKPQKKDKSAEYGFSLPPEPTGKCPVELQDKITNMYEKMNAGMDMNRVIQDRKEFRNPSIYEKLIQFCDIDELGTNYSPKIYDPLQWGKESFYEELARIQKVEMEKRDKDRKENIKQELVMAAAKKAEEEAKRRKSKWDQPAPGVSSAAATAASMNAAAAAAAQLASKPAGLVNATFTTNATGTKGTVISAFGSLPKKPKV